MGYLRRLGMPRYCWEIYAYCIENLSYDNWVRLSQAELAQELKANQSTISRGLRYLIDVDVIAKGPLAGRCNTYRLNPRIAHRGSRHYQSNIVQYDDLRQRRRHGQNTD